ncbi:hypothetical protein N7G274_007205 [Stereocaulon virgatum]|uniref:Galectin n=1 Tax=Stereocaulon virgatum TaxID=373712 RepID=A0ABR4A2Y4_9LECA
MQRLFSILLGVLLFVFSDALLVPNFTVHDGAKSNITSKNFFFHPLINVADDWIIPGTEISLRFKHTGRRVTSPLTSFLYALNKASVECARHRKQEYFFFFENDPAKFTHRTAQVAMWSSDSIIETHLSFGVASQVMVFYMNQLIQFGGIRLGRTDFHIRVNDRVVGEVEVSDISLY